MPGNRALRDVGQGHQSYQWRKKAGAIAASAAATCKARMAAPCRGNRGTHLIPKNSTIGVWAAMRSCQMWADAPSSAWGAVPCKAMKINSVAMARVDIAMGRNALEAYVEFPSLVSRGECRDARHVRNGLSLTADSGSS